MADNNLGSLFLTLGLKEEISSGLDKVVKKLSRTQQYSKELQAEIDNLRQSLKNASGTDLSEPFRKSLEFIKKYDAGLYQMIFNANKVANAIRGIAESGKGEVRIKLGNVQDAIRQLSHFSSQLAKIEDGDDKKAFRNKITNAIDYLKILQTIETKQRELDSLKMSSRNIDKGDIAYAKRILSNMSKELSNQLFNSKDGSLMTTGIMSEFKSLMSLQVRELADYLRNLKKDNPLSVFANAADSLSSKIANANGKIMEMQALMRGSKFPSFMDTSALNNLKGVVGKMQSLINKEGSGEKTSASKVQSLTSEYSKLISQVNLAISTFRNLNKEYDNANSRLQSWFGKYRQLQSLRGTMLKLNLDTSSVDKEINRVRALFSEINSIRKGLMSGNTDYIGKLGSRGTNADTRLYNNVVNSSRERIEEHKRLQAQIEKADADEYRRKQRQSEERLKQIDREAQATMKNAEAKMRVQAQVDKADADEYRRKQRQSEERLRQIDREAKAIMKNAETQQRLQAQLERSQQRAGNARQREMEIIRSRILSVTRALERMRETASKASVLGIDTTKINAAIQSLSMMLSELRRYRSELNNGGNVRIGNFGNGNAVNEQKLITEEYQRQIRHKENLIRQEARHQMAVKETAASIRNELARAYDQVLRSASRTSDVMRDIKSLFLQGGIVFGAQQLFNSIVRTGGEIVQQHIALRSILGDIQKADELFNQTQQLALQSPFKFGELNRDVKQLAAFGVEAKDLYETTKRLADIASGLGVSFERLGLAFGQVKARSWLDGKELRQFAYAGLPLLEKITNMYNAEGKLGRNDYTQSDVKKMISERKVSFEDVRKVLWQMTDEGGQFYNMQFVLSETLLGKWNKLIDAWEIFLSRLADGNNVVGDVFKGAISLVTELVLALDKLSPALVALSAVFVGRKLIGMAGLGIGSELANIQRASNIEMRRYAIKQNELVLEGKITQQEATRNIMKRAYILADKQTQAATMQKLALEGKLSGVQLRRAYQEGLVTKELIQQLEIMGAISATQARLILSRGSMAGVGLGLMDTGSMLGRAASGVMGFFGGPVGLGLTVAGGLGLGYYQSVSDSKQRIESMIKSSKQRSENLDEIINLNKTSPNDEDEYKRRIDNMKSVLEQSGYYTDSLKQQVEYAGSLADKYDILKKKIIEAKESSDSDAVHAKTAEIAVRRSGWGDAGMITTTGQFSTLAEMFDKAGWKGASDFSGWVSGLLSDDITTNADDLADSIRKITLYLEGLEPDRIESIANRFIDASDGARSLEEKLILISNNGKWDSFVRSIITGNVSTEKSMDNLSDKIKEVVSDIGEISEDDIPKIMRYISDIQGKSLSEFKQWAKAHPKEFSNMLDSIMKTIGDKGPIIKTLLYDAFYGFMNMNNPNKPITGNNAPTDPLTHNFTKMIREKLIGNIANSASIGGVEFSRDEINNALSIVNKDNYTETKEGIVSEYKKAKTEFDTIKKSGRGPNENDYKKAYNRYILWKEIVSKAGITDADKKNTTNKADKQLEQWRNRYEMYKQYRQLYNNAKEVMPKDKAQSFAKKSFSEMGDISPDNYKDFIAKLKNEVGNPTTDARRNFITTLDREMANWDLSETLKPQFEKAAETFKVKISEKIRQYELYKDLLDKTGNEVYAKSAYSDRTLDDENTEALKREFEKEFKMELPDVNRNAGDVEEQLKGLPGAYDTWKKIADIVKNNYYEYLKSGAEIIEKTMDYDERIEAITKRYDKLIKQAQDAGNIGLVARYEIDKGKEIGKVKNEKFVNSEEYSKFFTATLSLTNTEVQNLANTIKSELAKALKNGQIDAREYSKQLENIDKTMNKLRNKGRFLSGGLDAKYKNDIDKAESDRNAQVIVADELRRLIEEAEKKGNKDDARELKDKLAQAQINIDNANKKVKKAEEKRETWEDISKLAGEISAVISSIRQAFDMIRQTFSDLGFDTNSDAWIDANAYMESLDAVSGGVKTMIDGIQKGNPITGVITGLTQIVTGPISAFAKAHDAKLDKRIEQGERNIRAINNLSNNITKKLEYILGGIYTYRNDKKTNDKLDKILNENRDDNNTVNAVNRAKQTGNYFDTQYALLVGQRNEVQKQRNNEAKKKDSDDAKLDEYDQKLEELDIQIRGFVQDFLKEMYNIDLKSWARELTDAVVGAWQKGENAVEAYRNKVKEIMNDIMKNIIAQKVMEIYMEKPLSFLEEQLKTHGSLQEDDLVTLTKMLYDMSNPAVDTITGILDRLKKMGLDLTNSDTSTSSNSIKSITEETSDIIVSYINSIRADVSVNRKYLESIATNISCLPAMGSIVEEQLRQLTQLVQLANRRNGILDDIYRWMDKVSKGTLKVYIN